MKWNWRPLSLKSCHFEASKDIKTKFESKNLHIKRIKYWKASGSGKPPSLFPALRKIAILKQNKNFYTFLHTTVFNFSYVFKNDDTHLVVWSGNSNASQQFLMTSWLAPFFLTHDFAHWSHSRENESQLKRTCFDASLVIVLACLDCFSYFSSGVFNTPS
jgi:hypothetical protein